MSSGSERRRDPRDAAHFDVRFTRVEDAARAFNASSLNFSSGGLCVRSTSQYQIGEALSFALTIEGSVFELEGVVAWIRGDAVGVRFVNVLGDIRDRLERVAHSLAKTTPRVPRATSGGRRRGWPVRSCTP